jgi:hypothetical protein
MIAGLSWMLYLQFKNASLRKFYFPTLLLKIGAGVALGMLYKFHYGYGDTLGFDAESWLPTLKLTRAIFLGLYFYQKVNTVFISMIFILDFRVRICF